MLILERNQPSASPLETFSCPCTQGSRQPTVRTPMPFTCIVALPSREKPYSLRRWVEALGGVGANSQTVWYCTCQTPFHLSQLPTTFNIWTLRGTRLLDQDQRGPSSPASCSHGGQSYTPKGSPQPGIESNNTSLTHNSQKLIFTGIQPPTLEREHSHWNPESALMSLLFS